MRIRPTKKLAVLISLLFVAALLISVGERSRHAKRFLRELRAERQITLGADTTTVFLQAGRPSRTIVDENGYLLWFYLKPETEWWRLVVTFRKDKYLDTEWRAVRISLWPDDPLWLAEDGINTIGDAEQVISRYKKFYGQPCDTMVTSKGAEYYYRLPRKDEQRRASEKWGGKEVPARLLYLGLGGGKVLLDQGWTLLAKPNPQCAN